MLEGYPGFSLTPMQLADTFSHLDSPSAGISGAGPGNTAAVLDAAFDARFAADILSTITGAYDGVPFE
jgi:hypothetical protein